MRAALAAILLLFAVPARANQIDYFCLYGSAILAEADPALASYWDATNGVWDLSRVFPGVKIVTPQAVVNGISALTGFWIIVSNAGPVPALDADPACVMKLDRDAAAQGGGFVSGATLTGTGRTSLTFQPVPAGAAYPRPLGQ